MDNLLELFFNSRCVHCNRDGGLLCAECLRQCIFLENNNYRLWISRLRPQKLLYVTSAYDYEGPVRSCIRESKYGKKQFSALKILTRIALKRTEQSAGMYSAFVCTPIPLNLRKYRLRGFNQAELISTLLSKEWGVAQQTDVLYRKKETETQHNKIRKDRYANILDAFDTDPAKVNGKKVLLVDDICTTGATLTEAARTLYLNGAAEVKAFTLSKTTL